MATASHLLTLEEFHARYDGEKPYYEYWFGEAVQKSVPTWLHGVLQALISEFLNRAGYKVSCELELRVDPQWQPKADVAATLTSIPGPYPVKPIDIVVELVSPEDPMPRVFAKCRHYDRIGIGQIFVFDPESKIAWEWSRKTQNLERISTLALCNGRQIELQTVWDELDRRK